MADPILVTLYVALSLSQVLLMFVAIYYAHSIVRTVGTFWAWTLWILGFVLLALRDFVSIASILATPFAQLSSKTDVFTVTSVWPGTILNEAAYIALTIGVFGMNEIFARRSTVKKRRDTVTQIPLSTFEH